MRKHKKKANLYTRWLGYVGHYPGWMALAMGVVILAIIIDLAVPRVFAFVIDDMLSKTSISSGHVALPYLGSVDIALSFLFVALFLAILITIKGYLQYTRTVILTQVGECIHLEIRGELFEKIHHLPITFFDSSYTGKIMARITTDADAPWDLLFSGVNGVVAPLLTFLLVLTVVVTMTPLLSLMPLVVVPGFIVLFVRARPATHGHGLRDQG